MKNTYRNYTPEEIFNIFQDECRLCGLFDIEVDEGIELTKDMTVEDWRDSLNLLPWEKLYKAENEIFKVDLPFSAWQDAFWPESKKSLGDLCVFISQHAKKEVIHPVKIFSRECLGAAVFLTLKKNLLARGIDVKELKPSTFLRCFIDTGNFPYFLAEIVAMGTKSFESIKWKLRKDISFWQKINIFNSERFYLDTGSIKTFGDLSKKIAMGLTQNQFESQDI